RYHGKILRRGTVPGRLGHVPNRNVRRRANLSRFPPGPELFQEMTMSSSLLNTMTPATWKSLKEAAGIKKTPWYSTGSISVAAKPTAWKTARVKTKDIRKEIEKITYKFAPEDGKALADTIKALTELKTALEGMQTKAKAHKPKDNNESV